MNEIIKLQSTLDSNQEGWVIEFEDNQRFKIKGNRYMELHKLISGLSFKNTVTAIANGTVEETRAIIPDEFLSEFNQWVNEINTITNMLKTQDENAFQKAPRTNRKTFALWVREYHKNLAPYLFARLDNQDYLPMIYRKEF